MVFFNFIDSRRELSSFAVYDFMCGNESTNIKPSISLVAVVAK
jgi:hypothetical protein